MEAPCFAYPYYKAKTEQGDVLATFKGTNNKIAIQIPASYSGNVVLHYSEPVYWRLAELVSVLSLMMIIYKTGVVKFAEIIDE